MVCSAGTPEQFFDIGFLCHIRDSAGHVIELLQHTFGEVDRVNDYEQDVEQEKEGEGEEEGYQEGEMRTRRKQKNDDERHRPQKNTLQKEDCRVGSNVMDGRQERLHSQRSLFHNAAWGQITLRVANIEASLQFYTDLLEMRLLSIQPVYKYGFTLYFLACTDESPPVYDVSIQITKHIFPTISSSIFTYYLSLPIM